MKAIAFYLPQYHPIPENDAWWGKGFTEWTNVARSRPRFRGHYQPHIPADLGFYDLRLEETRIAQAELAKAYGIHGFCYYHYWFNGKMLLERPFNEVLNSSKPDFPFCLCWANENWTRRWDGKEHEILIRQDYLNYDAGRHISWLAKAFADQRYICVNGKPIFLIYKPNEIPDIRNVINLWREIARNKFGFELYLCAVKSWGNVALRGEKAIDIGFDAMVDFQPDPGLAYKDMIFNGLKNLPQKIWNKVICNISPLRFGLAADVNKIDLRTIVNEWAKNPPVVKEFPCVAPSWDNSPRNRACTVMQNSDPELYGEWLEQACKRVRGFDTAEQMVFINAWNEWGEGCHLEPDLRYGKKFLEITKKVLFSTTDCQGLSFGEKFPVMEQGHRV